MNPERENFDSGEQDRHRPDSCRGCVYLPGPDYGVRVSSDPQCDVHGQPFEEQVAEHGLRLDAERTVSVPVEERIEEQPSAVQAEVAGAIEAIRRDAWHMPNPDSRRLLFGRLDQIESAVRRGEQK